MSSQAGYTLFPAHLRHGITNAGDQHTACEIPAHLDFIALRQPAETRKSAHARDVMPCQAVLCYALEKCHADPCHALAICALY
jgi:hypothetical protein